MVSSAAVLSSPSFRDELLRRGGKSAGRCYQCATCSSVCELAPAEAPFPRRQMLWAQWGLTDRLVADPGVWLCHQCNDCNVRCPRDAQPGDVMQTLRALAVEHLAFPSFLGKLVGNVRFTWPLLVGVPVAFWFFLVALSKGFAIPDVDAELSFVEGRFHYDGFIPHELIYAVNLPVAAWVALAAWVSGRRFWTLLGGSGASRSGSFLAKLVPALVEVATHKRFSSCSAAGQRRWGHFGVMWGFVGAAVTSGLLVVYLYGFDMYPLPLTHWVKWLGNISAVLLVVGGVVLLANRLRGGRQAGSSTAFDSFFLGIVLAVIATGVLTEAGRFLFDPAIACVVYVMHLGVVLTLFLTFPYSKFAHLMYRTLAMVHRMMVAPNQEGRG